MKVLIDIGHPAHVHLFKNYAWIMQQNGHEVFITVRKKDVNIELLDAYKFDYKVLGSNYKSKVGKILGLLLFSFKLVQYSLRVKPDIFISHSSPYASFASWLLGKPNICPENNGNMEQLKIVKLFNPKFITSSSFKLKLTTNQIYYKGNHELAYLHPKYFENSSTHKKDIDSKIVLIRLVSWTSSHDFGKNGISLSNIKKLINALNEFGPIYISSEYELPEDLKKFQLKIKPEQAHNFLQKTSLYFGESATMASESALLGKPAIYIDDRGRYYTDELEEAGLVFNFNSSEFDKALTKAVTILAKNDFDEFKSKSKQYINEADDLTELLVNVSESLCKN